MVKTDIDHFSYLLIHCGMSESMMPIVPKRKKKKKRKASNALQCTPCMEKLAHEEEEEEEMEVEYSKEALRISEEGVTLDVQTIVANITSGNVWRADSVNENLWLILDTNIFLEKKKFILKLKEQLSRQMEHILFVIPWVVIQEIDRIKDGKDKKKKQTFMDRKQILEIQDCARAAVKIMNSWFEGRDPTVIGQDPRAAARINQNVYGFTIENNDDKVLHCCLQYQEKYSARQVALLTFDKNLRNKAMLMSVYSFPTEWLKKDEKKKECSSCNITQPSSSNETIHMSPVFISNPMCKAAAGHLVPFSCSDADPTSCMPVTSFQPVEASPEASSFPSGLSSPPNDVIPTPLPCSVLPPPAVTVKLEEELGHVYNCFDVVLKQFVFLRDHVRVRLSGPERPNEQGVAHLCHYICSLHDLYTRALSENESSDLHSKLVSLLNNFCLHNNLKVYHISQQALDIFFHDKRFREIVQTGLSQITSMRMDILECWQCFKPQAS